MSIAQHVVRWLIDFWRAYSSLLFVMLPSIIVALTKVQTPEANKVAGWLKYALNLLSIFTHKDSPGTLKMPLTQSQPASVCDNGLPPTPPADPTVPITGIALILALSVTLGVTTSGCCALTRTCKNHVINDTIDCTAR